MKETPIELARRMLSVTLHGGSPVLSHRQWQTITEALEARTEQQPVGWTDEVELRDVEKTGCGYLFKADPVSPNADPRRVIKLYREAPQAPAPVTVKRLQKRSVGEVMHMSGFSRDYAEGWCAGNDNARNEIQAAGIKIAEDE